MQNRNFTKRIYEYSRERFNLWQFIPLSLMLSGVLATGTQNYLNQEFLIAPFLLSAVALFLFFLRLRIFDEFKDYEHDLKYYPGRPVPRGLISKNELKLFLVPVIVLEFVIALTSGRAGIVLFLVSFIYSLLMLKEFFIKNWIKNRFTIYIFLHEILVFPLFFYLCAINGFKLAFFSKLFFWLLVVCVSSAIFLLEITRKFRSGDLEIASRDTYTAQYGIHGASMLLTTVSAVMVASIWEALFFLGLNCLPLIAISLLFVIFFYLNLYNFTKHPSAKTSKQVFVSSIYFVFVSCVAAIITFLIK